MGVFVVSLFSLSHCFYLCLSLFYSILNRFLLSFVFLFIQQQTVDDSLQIKREMCVRYKYLFFWKIEYLVQFFSIWVVCDIDLYLERSIQTKVSTLFIVYTMPLHLQPFISNSVSCVILIIFYLFFFFRPMFSVILQFALFIHTKYLFGSSVFRFNEISIDSCIAFINSMHRR